MVRNILRDAAPPITWLFLHTNLTANRVTAISLGVALGGIFCLAFPSAGMFLAGVLVLQLWYYLDHDHVDGQIARYRGTVSLTGRFFDFLTHPIIHSRLGPSAHALGRQDGSETGSFAASSPGLARANPIVRPAAQLNCSSRLRAFSRARSAFQRRGFRAPSGGAGGGGAKRSRPLTSS